jgi:hypothetical protein
MKKKIGRNSISKESRKFTIKDIKDPNYSSIKVKINKKL